MFASGTVTVETTAIRLRDVVLQFGHNRVLDSVDLDVRRGERIAVVGPSGVGKSSLLRLLAGLVLPTAGMFELNGQRQRYLREDQNKPEDVRLVFQSPALLASLSVEENVGFMLHRSTSLPPAEIRRRVSQVLEKVGLKGTETLMPAQLSGGMQKRVSFARAIVECPTVDSTTAPILLFDEPTAGLDPVACTRIENLIVKTTSLVVGTSLVVSHVMSTVLRTAHQVVMLYDGCFQWQGTVDAFMVTDNPYVVQFRGGSLEGPMQSKDLP